MEGVLQRNSIHQGLLEAQLSTIFPRLNIHKNAKKSADITHTTHGYLEVDVWLPEVNLCFEYQDGYHYEPAWYSQLPMSVIQSKDYTKRNKLRKRGQTVIVVPHWWDGSATSLLGTIHFQRPELLFAETEIPANPPSVLFAEYKQLMLASFPDVLDAIDEHNAWWIGEKWDGLRCYWNTTEKQLYSRHHVKLNFPLATDLFGHCFLDGELWCGRGSFHEAQHLLLQTWDFANNSCLRLVCFDEASVNLQLHSFETRYAFVLTQVPMDHCAVVITPRFLCGSEMTVLHTLQSAIEGGGEGLILRQPQSRYLPGRSTSLFKIKAAHNDQEALVVNVELDGSLLLQLPHGFTFSVARQDCMLHQRAVRGDIVSFSFGMLRRVQYKSLADLISSVPSTPVVHRIRSDLSWSDVMHRTRSDLFVDGLAQLSALHQSSTNLANYLQNKEHEALQYNQAWHYQKFRKKEAPVVQDTTQNIGGWKMQSARRAFFDGFAASHAFDSLNPVAWYHVSPSQLHNYHQSYQAIADYYGGKLPTALMHLYPDIGLRKELFKAHASWKNPEFRRSYFDKFALSKGMDERNPLFWYDVTTRELLHFHPGYSSISKYYGRKLSTVLKQLYPNIGLKNSLFNGSPQRARRAFFDSFARARGRDPLNAAHWYQVTPRDLLRYDDEYASIAKHYGGKLSTTLMALYPNIGLHKSGFRETEPSWQNESSRRLYFDEYAASQGKDALNPSLWYSVTVPDLFRYHKSISAILKYHGGKLSTTLLQLYPNIGLKKSYFKVKSDQSWKHENMRLAYFNNFAGLKGMDPLNPVFWQSVTIPELLKYHKGLLTILKYHDGKLSTALLQLYPNIGLQKYYLKAKTHSWKHQHARRAYFDSFAASKGKDSLNAAFWYTVSPQELTRFNNAYIPISKYHGGQLSTALIQLYPHIGLQASLFSTQV